MRVEVKFGTEVHFITIDNEVAATLGDLRRRLQEVTGVLPAMQKLLGKPKLQSTPETALLSSLGIRDGTKLMLIGSVTEDVVKANAASGVDKVQEEEQERILRSLPLNFWLLPPFGGFLADPYIEGKGRPVEVNEALAPLLSLDVILSRVNTLGASGSDAAATSTRLLQAIGTDGAAAVSHRFLRHLSATQRLAVQKAHNVVRICQRFTSSAIFAQKPNEVLEVLERCVRAIDGLATDGSDWLMLPAGWANKNTSNIVFLLIQRTSPTSYTLVVVNRGMSGANYHPLWFTADKMKGCPYLCFEGIDHRRMLDKAFWLLLLSLWIRQSNPMLYSEFNREEAFYDVLLPWLVERGAGRDATALHRYATELMLNYTPPSSQQQQEALTSSSTTGSSSAAVVSNADNSSDASQPFSPFIHAHGCSLACSDSSAIKSAVSAFCFLVEQFAQGDIDPPTIKMLKYVLKYEFTLRAAEDVCRYATRFLPDEPPTTSSSTATTTDKVGHTESARRGTTRATQHTTTSSSPTASPPPADTSSSSASDETTREAQLRRAVVALRAVGVDDMASNLTVAQLLASVAKLKVTITNGQRVLITPEHFTGKRVIVYCGSIAEEEGKTMTTLLAEASARLTGQSTTSTTSSNDRSSDVTVVPSPGVETVILWITCDTSTEMYNAHDALLPRHILRTSFPAVKLAKALGFVRVPELLIFGCNGQLVHRDGVRALRADPEALHYPTGLWRGAVPLSTTDIRMLQLSCAQLAHHTKKRHDNGTLSEAEVRHVVQFLSALRDLVEVIPQDDAHALTRAVHRITTTTVKDNSGDALQRVNDEEMDEEMMMAALDATLAHRISPSATSFTHTNLLPRCGTAAYYGKPFESTLPALEDLSDFVPPDSYAALHHVLTRADKVVEVLWARARHSSTASRVAVQMHLIEFITWLFTHIVPVPLLPVSQEITTTTSVSRSDAELTLPAEERDVVATFYVSDSFPPCNAAGQEHDTQMDMLSAIYSLMLSFTNAWQAVETPTRGFDAERCLVAMTMLVVYDAIARQMHGSTKCLLLASLLASEGGFYLSTRLGKQRRPFADIAARLELTRPHLLPIRSAVLRYIQRQEATLRHELFDLPMPDKLEVRKGSATVHFLRLLLDHAGYELDDSGAIMARATEMDKLMEWFCSPRSPLARHHREFGMLRDMVLLTKFLATMEMREAQLLHRRKELDPFASWRLTFEEDHPGRQLSAGWRTRPMPPRWECALVRGRDSDIADLVVNGFGDRDLLYGEGMVLHSPIDVSRLLGVDDAGEDDVLHATALPSFGNSLSSAESEQLLSCLTAPYLRIPLLLDFFASQDRHTYLFIREVQDVVRAVLFEPGAYVTPEALATADPRTVPMRLATSAQRAEQAELALRGDVDAAARLRHERDLGTTYGLLLNELTHAPAAVLQPLRRLLTSLTELGPSSVYSANASYVLFIVGLVSDVLGFGRFVSEKGLTPMSNAAAHKALLMDYLRSIMTYLTQQVQPLLLAWLHESEDNTDTPTQCVVHAYMAIVQRALWRTAVVLAEQPVVVEEEAAHDEGNNATQDECLVRMLQSCAFVRARHGFGMGMQRTQLAAQQGDDLLTPEEKMLRFLQAQGLDTSHVSREMIEQGKQLMMSGGRRRAVFVQINSRLHRDTVRVPNLFHSDATSTTESRQLKLPPADVPESALFALLLEDHTAITHYLEQQPSLVRQDIFHGIVRCILRDHDTAPDGTSASAAQSTGMMHPVANTVTTTATTAEAAQEGNSHVTTMMTRSPSRALSVRPSAMNLDLLVDADDGNTTAAAVMTSHNDNEEEEENADTGHAVSRTEAQHNNTTIPQPSVAAVTDGAAQWVTIAPGVYRGPVASGLLFHAQTCELFWRNDELKPVPDSMSHFTDYENILGKEVLQCGLVSRHEHRHWVHIVGTAYDVVEWTAPPDVSDQGVHFPLIIAGEWPKAPVVSAVFEGVTYDRVVEVNASKVEEAGPWPVKAERWAIDLLRAVLPLNYPSEMKFSPLAPARTSSTSDAAGNATLGASAEGDTATVTQGENNTDDDVVHEMHFIMNDAPQYDDEEERHTWKEVVAYRYPQPHLAVFNLVPHARKIYRSLIFSSNQRYCLHSLALLSRSRPREAMAEVAFQAGELPKRIQHESTLEIYRYNAELGGREVYVPARLLQGLVPSALLESFFIWQGEDDVLRGYPLSAEGATATVRDERTSLVKQSDKQTKEEQQQEETKGGGAVGELGGGQAAGQVVDQWFSYALEIHMHAQPHSSNSNTSLAVLPPSSHSSPCAACTVIRRDTKQYTPIRRNKCRHGHATHSNRSSTNMRRTTVQEQTEPRAGEVSILTATECVMPQQPTTSTTETTTSITGQQLDLHDRDAQRTAAIVKSTSHNEEEEDERQTARLHNEEEEDDEATERDTRLALQESTVALLQAGLPHLSHAVCAELLRNAHGDVTQALQWATDPSHAAALQAMLAAPHTIITTNEEEEEEEYNNDTSGAQASVSAETHASQQQQQADVTMAETDLVLINLLHYPALAPLLELLTGIEDSSHILVWGRPVKGNTTRKTSTEGLGLCPETDVCIEFIELPRLRAKFYARRDGAKGRRRLFLADQPGWRVAERDDFAGSGRARRLRALRAPFQQGLILCNATREVALMVPNHDFTPMTIELDPFNPLLLFDRSSYTWREAVPSPFYLYTVHPCDGFLVPPTLSASLYLAVMQCATQHYADAMRSLEACYTDSPFSPEEAYMFALFGRTLRDRHPDAHAVRLKLAHAVQYSTNQVDWPVALELTGYLMKKRHVSASCQLRRDELLDLLKRYDNVSPLLRAQLKLYAALLKAQRHHHHSDTLSPATRNIATTTASTPLLCDEAGAKDRDALADNDDGRDGAHAAVTITTPPMDRCGFPWERLLLYPWDKISPQKLKRITFVLPDPDTLLDEGLVKALWDDTLLADEESGANAKTGFYWLYNLHNGAMRATVRGTDISISLSELLARWFHLRHARWGREAERTGELELAPSWCATVLRLMESFPSLTWPTLCTTIAGQSTGTLPPEDRIALHRGVNLTPAYPGLDDNDSDDNGRRGARAAFAPLVSNRNAHITEHFDQIHRLARALFCNEAGNAASATGAVTTDVLCAQLRKSREATPEHRLVRVWMYDHIRPRVMPQDTAMELIELDARQLDVGYFVRTNAKGHTSTTNNDVDANEEEEDGEVTLQQSQQRVRVLHALCHAPLSELTCMSTLLTQQCPAAIAQENNNTTSDEEGYAALPFDIRHHPLATTPLSQDMLRRLEQDSARFAEQQRTSISYCFTLLPRHAVELLCGVKEIATTRDTTGSSRNAVEEDNGDEATEASETSLLRTTLRRASEALAQCEEELHALSRHDARVVARMTRSVLALANDEYNGSTQQDSADTTTTTVPAAASTHAQETSEALQQSSSSPSHVSATSATSESQQSGNARRHTAAYVQLDHSLQRLSHSRVPVTLEWICAALLSTKLSNELHAINPLHGSIATLRAETVLLMLLSNRGYFTEQSAQAVHQVRLFLELCGLLRGILAPPTTTKEEEETRHDVTASAMSAAEARPMERLHELLDRFALEVPSEVIATLQAHYAQHTPSSSPSSSSLSAVPLPESTARLLVSRLQQLLTTAIDLLTAQRYYVNELPSSSSTSELRCELDPRFLIFEFLFNILLRQRQVEMVRWFVHNLRAGQSRVQQMIMGQGKTTVVGPLLTLMLADGAQLVTQVMPTALLEQTRGILRRCFSVVLVKHIFTIQFDRSYSEGDSSDTTTSSNNNVKLLCEKLRSAQEQHAVVIAAPECLKSLFLKYIEQLHMLRNINTSDLDGTRSANEQDTMEDDRHAAQRVALRRSTIARSELAECMVPILRLWQGGVLMMDEVDVLLHPLRSELNFPMGLKHPIDLAGHRWRLPIHLLDAIFHCQCGRISEDVQHQLRLATRSFDIDLLDSNAQDEEEGEEEAHMQDTPAIREEGSSSEDAGLYEAHDNRSSSGDDDVAYDVENAEENELNANRGSTTALGTQRGATTTTTTTSHVGDTKDAQDTTTTPVAVQQKVRRMTLELYRRAALRGVRRAVERGFRERALQREPHLVLLDTAYYEDYLLPALVPWLQLWLHREITEERGQQMGSTINSTAASQADEMSEFDRFVRHTTNFLRHPLPDSTAHEAYDNEEEEEGSHGAKRGRDDEEDERRAIAYLNTHYSAFALKLLNLAHDWLHRLLPHVLSKIDRVSFGLLQPADLALISRSELAHMPHSRKMMAVPFIAKDVPSRSSEFAHPDVVIGLTILAYRYEGLRPDDSRALLTQLKQDFARQAGPKEHRPAARLYRRWLYLSGLSPTRRTTTTGKYTASAQPDAAAHAMSGAGLTTTTAATTTTQQQHHSWSTVHATYIGNGGEECAGVPLSQLQVTDRAQMHALHHMLRAVPEVVHYYLCSCIFPRTMNFQSLKISACGHELGSSMLFTKRIGFSGTPSNLLPLDLGECFYEPGSDGRVLSVLTNHDVVYAEQLPDDWTPLKVLDRIATARPPLAALIDSGALITNMENEDVARYLLARLPATLFDGVVFLDGKDRQMILQRDKGLVVPVAQCGVPLSRRFSFFDQVHTTGTDVKQSPTATAVMTLGKDLVFRDYAQGAYRMRGIGKGQRLCLYLIPEVVARIDKTLGPEYRTGDILRDVPAWLLLNSMRVEGLQFFKLSLQELANVWRKKALSNLVADTVYADMHPDLFTGYLRCRRFHIPRPAARITTMMTHNAGQPQHTSQAAAAAAIVASNEEEEQSTSLHTNNNDHEEGGMTTTHDNNSPSALLPSVELLQASIDEFSEPIEYPIHARIAAPQPFIEHVMELLRSKSHDLIADDAHSQDLVQQLLQRMVKSVHANRTAVHNNNNNTTTTSSGDGGAEGSDGMRGRRRSAAADAAHTTMDLNAEIVHEQEAEEEQEQEAEQEEQRVSAFSRDDEFQLPWSIDTLRRCGAVPHETLRPMHGSCFYQVNAFQIHSHQPRLRVSPRYLLSDNYFRLEWHGVGERRLKNAFLFLEWVPDATGSARREGVKALNDTQDSSASQSAEEKRADSHTSEACATEEEAAAVPRKDCCAGLVTLAEGESLRWMMHHSAYFQRDIAAALRFVSTGQYMDYSPRFTPHLLIISSSGAPQQQEQRDTLATHAVVTSVTRHGLQPVRHACDPAALLYRFFNNDMFFSVAQLRVLERKVLCDVAPEDRLQFFEDCLRLRRRQRNHWEDAPVAVLFVAPRERPFLRQLALCQKLRGVVSEMVEVRRKAARPRASLALRKEAAQLDEHLDAFTQTVMHEVMHDMRQSAIDEQDAVTERPTHDAPHEGSANNDNNNEEEEGGVTAGVQSSTVAATPQLPAHRIAACLLEAFPNALRAFSVQDIAHGLLYGIAKHRQQQQQQPVTAAGTTTQASSSNSGTGAAKEGDVKAMIAMSQPTTLVTLAELYAVFPGLDVQFVRDVVRAAQQPSHTTTANYSGAAAAMTEWACPVCTYINDITLGVCAMCLTTRPAHFAAAAAIVEGDNSANVHATQQANATSNNEGEEEEEDGPWACAVCTFINTSRTQDMCSVCLAPNPTPLIHKSGSAAGGKANAAASAIAWECPEGYWVCSVEHGGCSKFNPNSVFYCQVCEKARPDLASVRF